MSRSHRIEKDSLGEVRVPVDALYGAQTQRAAENFPISGRRFTRRFIEALGRLKEAAAETNAELGLVPESLADALLESITLLANGSAVFTERCVAGITARPERARELLERNPSIATALNAYIGYDKAAVVARKAASEGRSVRDVVEEMGLAAPEQLDDALDVRGMTEPGIPGKG